MSLQESHPKEESQRKIGFELEFSGLSIEEASAAVQSSMQGELIKEQPLFHVIKSKIGDFKVELDWKLAQEFFKAHEEVGESSSKQVLFDGAKSLAEKLAPIEVVCPPLTLLQIEELNLLTKSLRLAGATGTHGSPFYAFGVHINPELPDYSAECIIRHLKAFVVSQKWLLATHKVDLTRRISPFIGFYPKTYCQIVMSYQGNESLEELLEDYIRYNPTRNRALDVLPLFKHLMGKKFKSLMKDELVKARPTFHYRMPNCEIDDPEWSLKRSWRIWRAVEKLAASDELEEIQKEWHQFYKEFFVFGEEPWKKKLEVYLEKS